MMTLPLHENSTKNLIMSGGDGYIDFRVDEDSPVDPIADVRGHATAAAAGGLMSRGDKSHLIVWELMNHQMQQQQQQNQRLALEQQSSSSSSSQSGRRRR